MTQHQVQSYRRESVDQQLREPATDVVSPATHPAVYLLDEIADMARQSPEAATAIAEAVQKKLAAKNPVVKFKVGAHSDAVSSLQPAPATCTDPSAAGLPAAGPQNHQAPQHKGLFPLPEVHAAALDLRQVGRLMRELLLATGAEQHATQHMQPAAAQRSICFAWHLVRPRPPPKTLSSSPPNCAQLHLSP